MLMAIYRAARSPRPEPGPRDRSESCAEPIISGGIGRGGDGDDRPGPAARPDRPRPAVRSIRSTRSSARSGSARSSASARSPSGCRSPWTRREEAGRAAAAHPLRRPAGAGQDDVRHRPAQRAGRRAGHDQRPGAGQEHGRHALPDQRGRGLDPVHRRDPPPAQDRRGVHLPGHGGLPGRHRPRRGDERADDQPAAEAVHDHRRHDPQRDALRPAPRPVPPPRTSRILRG